MIAALFSIHKASNDTSRQCGTIREEYGMHRVEMLLKTIEEINNSSEILPGITLGVDIRDTCWNGQIALEQSVDFIKYSIQHNERGNIKQQNSEQAIATLIGPAASEVTILVQNMLQLFSIPQIGYSATTVELSNVGNYKFFLRVVPSDKLQVQALVEVIKYFEWKFISILYSKGKVKIYFA